VEEGDTGKMNAGNPEGARDRGPLDLNRDHRALQVLAEEEGGETRAQASRAGAQRAATEAKAVRRKLRKAEAVGASMQAIDRTFSHDSSHPS
jgi:hypothetical protein